MDIDELVRQGRPDQSTGWARSDPGRRVLDGVIGTASAVSASRRTVSGRSVARRPALRWSFAGTGLIGAAVAAALVASALTSTPTDGPQQPGTPPGVTGDSPADVTALGAREILLAAASRAERAPADTGRYWHVKTLNIVGPVRVGTASDGYWLVSQVIDESWDARDRTDASWTGRRELGSRPRAEADEAAWRAAGSPTTWTREVDGSSGTRTLSTLPGPGKLTKDTAPPRYLEDIGQLSLEQVRQLPEDQRALRDWVTRRIQTEMGYAPGTASGDRMLFGFLSRMLLDTPAAPKVRASAFRILADIPGVRSLGTVQDDSGRSGQGVEFTDGVTTELLIIDGSTHLLLAAKVSSNPKGTSVPTKQSSRLVLSAQWSDAAPQVPTLPQG